MNDTIFIHGIIVHAHHGMLNHEAEVGQRFVIDVELFVALLEASHTDELTDTVCYADVARATISTFACQNYQLLERAAGAVGDTRGVKHRKLDLAPEVTHCSQPWSNRRIHAGHVLNRQRPFGIEFSVKSVEEINKACPLKYESNFE